MHTEEDALHGSTYEVSSDEAQAGSNASEDDAFTKDQIENAALAGTEGHAHSDLMRALRHREGHDAVDADGCEQQRDGGEDAEEDEGESVIGHHTVMNVLHAQRI